MDFRPEKVFCEVWRIHEQMGFIGKPPPYSPLDTIQKLYGHRVIISTTAALGDGENGFIHRDPGYPGISFITLNRNDPGPTKIATLAHELGHLALAHRLPATPGRRLCRITQSQTAITDVIEREANTFMAEFLVPLNVLARCFRKNIADVYQKDPEGLNVEADLLALQFGVSTPFIKKQLWRLHRRRMDRWGM